MPHSEFLMRQGFVLKPLRIPYLGHHHSTLVSSYQSYQIETSRDSLHAGGCYYSEFLVVLVLQTAELTLILTSTIVIFSAKVSFLVRIRVSLQSENVRHWFKNPRKNPALWVHPE